MEYPARIHEAKFGFDDKQGIVCLRLTVQREGATPTLTFALPAAEAVRLLETSKTQVTDLPGKLAKMKDDNGQPGFLGLYNI